MSVKYGDLPIEHESVIRWCARGENFDSNISGDRISFKWETPTPQVLIDLGVYERTKSEAMAYYGDANNGWTIEL